MGVFGGIAGGWQRVQAICDYVHDRIEFGYHHARCDRTASEGHEERIGVCRDFAHLAVTLCRYMNIPDTVPVISAISGFLGIPHQWISARGPGSFLAVVGTRSMHVTIIRVSAGSSSPAAMRPQASAVHARS